MSELVTLRVARGWEDMLEGEARERLETRVLPGFLRGRRWFGGKARTIEATSVRDWAWIEAGARFALAVVDVYYADHPAEAYFLPLGFAAGESDAALCGIQGPGGPGFLIDALADDRACLALLAALDGGHRFPARRGEIRAFPGRAFEGLRGGRGAAVAVRRSSAEQSNTSVIFGERLIMKAFRRLEPGPNPDFEIVRYLADEAGFEHVPRLAGGIEYAQRDYEPATLAMFQELVANRGDGWKGALEALQPYYQRAAQAWPSEEDLALNESPLPLLFEEPAPALARETIGDYLESAARLGRRTGEMHLALAGAAGPGFAPEPVTRDHLGRLGERCRAQAARAFDALDRHLHLVPPAMAESAAAAVGRRDLFFERFAELQNLDLAVSRIRVHGDFHLGQVLCAKGDFVIVDFEGEPARPLAERRSRQLALKDVAGMLRSFSYAAYAGLVEHAAAALEPWAIYWERWTSAAFLKAYLATVSGALFVPADAVMFEELLEVFLLDKALYELLYELNNRPDWVRIPLRGILALAGLERESGRGRPLA